MKDFCKDNNVGRNEKGLQVHSMDSSRVALVSVLLYESAFPDVKCGRPTASVMSVDSLAQILELNLGIMVSEAHLQHAKLLEAVDAMNDLCKDMTAARRAGKGNQGRLPHRPCIIVAP